MLGVIHWGARLADDNVFCVISKESGDPRHGSSTIKHSTGSRNPSTKGEFNKERIQKGIAKSKNKTKANVIAGRSYSAGGVTEVRSHLSKISPQ